MASPRRGGSGSALEPLAAWQAMSDMLIDSDGSGSCSVGAPLASTANKGNGHTTGFNAPSSDAVDAFDANGLAQCGTSESEPSLRAGFGL